MAINRRGQLHGHEEESLDPRTIAATPWSGARGCGGMLIGICDLRLRVGAKVLRRTFKRARPLSPRTSGRRYLAMRGQPIIGRIGFQEHPGKRRAAQSEDRRPRAAPKCFDLQWPRRRCRRKFCGYPEGFEGRDLPCMGAGLIMGGASALERIRLDLRPSDALANEGFADRRHARSASRRRTNLDFFI